MRIIQNPTLKQKWLAESALSNQFSFSVTAACQLVFFAAKEPLIVEHQTADYLFYLVQGRTKLSHSLANGKTVITDFFTPPCFIGEMELIDPTSPAFAVTAVEDCWCLALKTAPIKDQLINDPVFLRQICLYLTHKEVANIRVAARNQAFTAAQRLANFILLTAHQNIYSEQHTQVAPYLGITYRHLLYVLAEFVQQGYLSKTPGGYRIDNRPALVHLARDLQA